MGMNAQFVEAPDLINQALEIPEEIRAQCSSGHCPSVYRGKAGSELSEMEGNATGNITEPMAQDTEKEMEKGSGQEKAVEDEMAFMFQSDKVETWWDKIVRFFTSLLMF